MMNRREVTPLWVAERTQHRPRVIDVREPFETISEAGHIPGAESVPLTRLEHVVAQWPRDASLVVVDADGSQAERVCNRLVTLGFKDTAWMKGGMRAWSDAALPLAFAPEREDDATPEPASASSASRASSATR